MTAVRVLSMLQAELGNRLRVLLVYITGPRCAACRSADSILCRGACVRRVACGQDSELHHTAQDGGSLFLSWLLAKHCGFLQLEERLDVAKQFVSRHKLNLPLVRVVPRVCCV